MYCDIIKIPRLVINSGVNDTAIVPALMARDAIFLFEHEKTPARKAVRDFERDPESYRAASDDDYVVAGISHAVWSCRDNPLATNEPASLRQGPPLCSARRWEWFRESYR